MILSKKKAMTFFKDRALPRRVEDIEAAQAFSNATGRYKKFWRRVGNDEPNRGKLYPIMHDGMETFAHFGIGIGIYFAQLVVLSGVSFICGMIMLTAAYQYQKDDFGDSSKPVPFSAVCSSVNVTATVGCPGGLDECLVDMRPNCELQGSTVIADLIMCIVYVVVFFASKFIEQRIEEKLDETVQTSQDYSIEVLDPNVDADDPDEWHRFFKKFGDVRYITIIRRNSLLTDLIVDKHTYTRKLQESGKLGSKLALKREVLDTKYEEITATLKAAMNITYPVCRVYVTFENEEDQRRCLEKLKVPFIQSFFDMKSRFPKNYRFRGDNILNVGEPPEPDNIIWKNLEVDKRSTYIKRTASVVLTVALMVTFWYLIFATSQVSPNLTAVIIGVVDTALPTIYTYITDLSFPQSEGFKQSSLQMRLFGARLLLSTIIPYVQSKWHDALAEEFLSQVIVVQITTCFTAPIMAWLDMPGLIQRHVIAPFFSDTQEEMNNHFLGSDWSLAEKYTGLSKVLFVSLFYSLLAPISILISTVAFVLIFCIDNFLLLRRWKAASMLDSKIATRLRQQAILAVAAHMFITMRYIYSWPMDNVYWNGSQYEVVDKYPTFAFWNMKTQTWHSHSQRSLLIIYQVGLFLVGGTALYMFLLEPLSKGLYQWFFNGYVAVGKPQGIPFSKIANIKIYYPILKGKDQHFLCSYTKNVLQRHRPVLIESASFAKDDLSCYVPIEKQMGVLSIVKYYGECGLDRMRTGHHSHDRDLIVKTSSRYQKKKESNPLVMLNSVLKIPSWSQTKGSFKSAFSALTGSPQKDVALSLTNLSENEGKEDHDIEGGPAVGEIEMRLMDHFVEGGTVLQSAPAIAPVSQPAGSSKSDHSSNNSDTGVLVKSTSARLKQAAFKMSSNKSLPSRTDSIEEGSLENSPAKAPLVPLAKSRSLKKWIPIPYEAELSSNIFKFGDSSSRIAPESSKQEAGEPSAAPDRIGSPDKQVNAKVSLKPIPTSNENSAKVNDSADPPVSSATTFLQLLESHNNLGLEPGDDLEITLDGGGDEEEEGRPMTEVEAAVEGGAPPPANKSEIDEV